MKRKEVILCGPIDFKCPSVTISDNEVTIGEDANTVKLKPVEWNILVDAIKKGKLDKVKV